MAADNLSATLGPRVRFPVSGLDWALLQSNECADRNHGQRDAARNKVPSPSDTSYARLPLRRLGGVLARRLDPGPAVLPGDGGEDPTTLRTPAPRNAGSKALN